LVNSWIAHLVRRGETFLRDSFSSSTFPRPQNQEKKEGSKEEGERYPDFEDAFRTSWWAFCCSTPLLSL
jgi:hypothetical protein